MKRLFGLAAAVTAAAACAGAAHAQTFPVKSVEFSGGPAQNAQLAKPKVTVYGDDAAPAFMGDQAFVFGYAGNSSGRVYEWDTVRQRVRISADGQPGVWLACDDLQAMPIACSTSLKLSMDGALLIGASNGGSATRPTRGGVLPGKGSAPNGRGVPNCPGDPRCPKLGR